MDFEQLGQAIRILKCTAYDTKMTYQASKKK